MSFNQKDTLNNQFVKHINYMSEEYIKTLLVQTQSGKDLRTVNPFCGVISYPSDQFLQPDKTYNKIIQFQNSYYVGHIEMLLPVPVAPVDSGLSYTLLEFRLDGVLRRFLQISEGATVSNGQRFSDFVNQLYPTANGYIPFNRNGIHVLSDIDLSGGVYVPSANGFTAVQDGSGVFTPAIEFEISVSGYRCIMQ